MSEQNGSVDTGGQPGANGAGGEWYAGIADNDLRGYVQTKGFKDPAALADSYRNLEKLVGVPQERLLRLPEKADDPAWDGIYGKLGRPGKPEEYGLTGDEALLKTMLPEMHKLGVSKSQAEGLAKVWDGYVNSMIEADTRERATKDAAELAELRTKWGAKYDEHVELGRRAGREFGLSEDEFKAVSASLGSGKTLELFHRIGAKLGEPAPLGDGAGAGGGSSFGMTKEQAQARIKTLSGDPAWTAKYLEGGSAENEEMSRLQRIAAGG